mmetsp:Transcript_54612/g.109826  ORF Transcript_54612/g.109826 Transcript_54612/m.109826 type:complete len:223 (+) Transcript_54612:66-734(+)
MEQETFGGIRQPWGWESVKSFEDDNEPAGSSGVTPFELEVAKTEKDPLIKEDEKKCRFSFCGLVAAVVFIGIIASLFSVMNQFNLAHEKPAGAIRCIDNSACASAGLIGDCCPTTPRGKKLDCCSAANNVVIPHSTFPGACDDNKACALLGVAGTCCPLQSRAATPPPPDLACCSDSSNEVRSSHPISAACVRNSACKFQGLSGNCCPTDDGAILGCCPAGS